MDELYKMFPGVAKQLLDLIYKHIHAAAWKQGYDKGYEEGMRNSL